MTRSTSRRSRIAAQTRSTFMVEALLLLACVLLLVAVSVSLFAFASGASSRARQMQEAADIAQNAAETFVADPASVPEVQSIEGFLVRCDVDEERSGAGALLSADILVMRDADEVCAIQVSKYVSAADALDVAGIAASAQAPDTSAAGMFADHPLGVGSYE